MELGALVCLPNGAPEVTAVRRRGSAWPTGRTKPLLLPVKGAKSRTIGNRTVYLLFSQRKGCPAAATRGLLAGLWEFPNELAETPVSDQWGCPLSEFCGTNRHIFTHRSGT